MNGEFASKLHFEIIIDNYNYYSTWIHIPDIIMKDINCGDGSIAMERLI